MIPALTQLLIVLLIAGFIYYCYTLLIPLAPVAEPFKSLLNAVVLIIVGAIVLFYAVIPIIELLSHSMGSLKLHG